MLVPQNTIAKVVDEVRKTSERVSIMDRNQEIYGYQTIKGVSWGINNKDGMCIMRAIRTSDNDDIYMEIHHHHYHPTMKE